MASAVSKRRSEAEQTLRHQQQRLVRRVPEICSDLPATVTMFDLLSGAAAGCTR